ncbi:MAG: acetyl-CoA C-acyltransferase [Bdellovibrionales bacterium]|nr:acetyl-CoA C-acyltransferase [Bdellovibrionales bacterium]
MASIQNVAVVGGVRTPFVKAGTHFQQFTMQELGVHVLKAIVTRYELDPESIDEFIFSTVLLDPRTPNWAREIVFAAGLPKTLYAHSVSNNCISGLIAITSVAERIALGAIHCGIAGGSESMSNPALLFSKSSSDIFLEMFRARSTSERLKTMLRLRPRHFAPKPPGVTEPSTGLTMGQHMEITAQQLAIARQVQDEIAFASHQNAAKAISEGLLVDMIEPLAGVTKDTLVRGDTSLEKLSQLKPVFDRSGKGTLTAGNSSALTDGASAVLLMDANRAKAEGREPLAMLTHYEYAAIDPNDGLLMAPAVAVPRLLKRLGLRLEDFDLLEIHEAFGAQVAANIKAWEEGWKLEAIGKVDRSKMNTLGGSIALGHPFAATGGRMVATLASELHRRSLKRGLISICAAGAMAGAIILER